MAPKLDFVRPTKTTTTTRKSLGKRLCTNLLHLLSFNGLRPDSLQVTTKQTQLPLSACSTFLLRTGPLLCPSQALSVPCPVLEPSVEACVSTHPNGSSVPQGRCWPPFYSFTDGAVSRRCWRFLMVWMRNCCGRVSSWCVRQLLGWQVSVLKKSHQPASWSAPLPPWSCLLYHQGKR